MSVGDNGRGIYLREPYQIGKLVVVSVSVEPKFHLDAGIWISFTGMLHQTVLLLYNSV